MLCQIASAATGGSRRPNSGPTYLFTSSKGSSDPIKHPLSGFEPIIECYSLGEEYFCFDCELGATVCVGFVNGRHLWIPQCNGKGGTRCPKSSRRYSSTSKISQIQAWGDEPPLVNDTRVFYKRICEVKRLVQTLVSPYFASEPYSWVRLSILLFGHRCTHTWLARLSPDIGGSCRFCALKLQIIGQSMFSLINIDARILSIPIILSIIMYLGR
jgi:hypothetical protein